MTGADARPPNGPTGPDAAPGPTENPRTAATVAFQTSSAARPLVDTPHSVDAVTAVTVSMGRQSASQAPFPAVPGYVIVRRLGGGGMGEVYEAINRLGRRFALKLIRRDSGSEDMRARFRKEAAALLDLDHPHVARIFEYNEADGVPYFTMRLLTGGPLSERREAYRDNVGPAVGLMATIADAVGYLHRRGLLHRDLKPSNILFDENDVPYVSDFGLVKELASPDVESHEEAITAGRTTSGGSGSTDDPLTARGQRVGTLRYMSPEQIDVPTGRIGPWSDVWALGVMLYELLGGRRPFEGDDTTTLRSQIETDRPPPLRELNPALDVGLERIVSKCLARRPEDRYAGGGELAEALQAWLKQHAKVRRPWRTLLIVAGIAVALAVCVWAVLFFSDPDRELHAAQRRLEQGQSAQVLAAKGMPIHFRRHTGPEANVYLDQNGHMTVTTQRLAMVELMPDPMGERYRFKIQVRQNTHTSRASRAGIYCLHSVHENERGRHHCFLELSLREDDHDQRDVWKFEKPGPNRSVTSIVHDVRVAGEMPIYNAVRHAGGHAFESDAIPDTPAPWRQLEFEVTAERVTARFEGKEIGKVDRALLPRRMASLLSANGNQGLKPPLDARSSLGLYVLGSSASFRLGAIEPLPPDPR